MLDARTAQSRLEEFAVPHPLERQIERAQDLPPALRTAAFTLLGCDIEGKPFTSYRTSPGRTEAQTAAATLCDALTVPERERLFTALFPRLGRAMARWWSPDISPLHHVGWNPRPFRLPGSPAVSRPSRLQQLQGLLSDSPHFGIARFSEQDAIWFATYAGYLGSENSRTLIGDRIGAILSASIDRSDPAEANAVQEILLLSAKGTHPVGTMGRHVVRALLSSARTEGWDCLTELLAEQGEREPIRRSILEVAGEAHPDAFRRILALVREKNLLRFPDVIHSVINWLGIGEEGFDITEGNAVLEQIETFLQDEGAREKAILSGTNGQTAFYAFWSTAFLDVRPAIAQAARHLSDPSAERRFAAAYLLSLVRLPDAESALLNTLNDPDLRVAAFAFHSIDWHADATPTTPTESPAGLPVARIGSSDAERKEQEREGGLLGALRGFVAGIAPGNRASVATGGRLSFTAPPPASRFDRIAENLPRFPAKERSLEPILWQWTRRSAAQSALADTLPLLLEDRPLVRLQPFLPMMSANGRWQLADLLADPKRTRNPESARLLITLLLDGAANVRTRAADALKRYELAESEAGQLEALLARKIPADTQRTVVALLAHRPDEDALGSADRLLSSPLESLRLSGLQILVLLQEKRRAPEPVRDLVENWINEHDAVTITEAEMSLLRHLLPPRRITALSAARMGR